MLSQKVQVVDVVNGLKSHQVTAVASHTTLIIM